MEQDYSTERKLLNRFNQGLTTPEENLAVNHSFNEFAKSSSDNFSDTNIDKFRDRIWAKLPMSVMQPAPTIKRLWPRMIIAAASVALVVLGIYFFTTKNGTANNDNLNAQDVTPGTVGATLTLANGKQIKLSDAANGKLAEEAGISISKTRDGQLVYVVKQSAGGLDKINRLSTAKGETYVLTLPDKSKVWLNAASSLTYSASLRKNGKRWVRLEGEAYFEIAKDRAHPFIVETKKQEVEVLGTHFNLNSYADENAIATTLLEGSVKITAGNLKKVLVPGQQALNTGNALNIAEVNIESITDWKEGGFYLDNVDFKTAMRKIARWYDVEIIYDRLLPDDLETGGWISRNKKLSAVLMLIEASGHVHFKIEGRKVYVLR